MRVVLLIRQITLFFEEQWWHSGESTHPPQMWPEFNFQTWPHMWVEFVGSFLCSERFTPLLKNLHVIKFELY